MSSPVPVYQNVCIAPTLSGSAIWLVGVPVANEGRLEAYSISLTNINSPTATLVANQSNPLYWSSQAQKACFNFPGNSANPNSPVMMQQFGTNSYLTNIYPNGTIDFPSNFQGVGFVSPKVYSLSGAVGPVNWFTAVANVSSLTTNSPWTGLRMNGTEETESDRDFIISLYPTSNPLLSVGTYIPTSNTPAQGYHIVFDTIGGGVIYTALDSAAPIITSQDRILSLSSPQNVDMGGFTLTSNAVPITMASVAYILDQAPDGSTVMYTINPSQTAKLQRVSVQGNVPSFSASLAATTLNSQIVIYTAGTTAAIFNAFDTVAGSWSGSGLVTPYVYPTTSSSSSGSSQTSPSSSSKDSSSKAPIGAIIGGVVGGLVVIALVAFLFIRHRRRNNGASAATATPAAALGTGAVAPPMSAYDSNAKNEGYAVAPAPVLQQTYQPPMQPGFQQQQYNPHHSYIPQGFSMDSTKTSPQPQPLQQHSPMIFQPQQQPYVDQTQQAYHYTPPTLTAVPQPVQSHQIFQPQVDAASNPSYTQAIYTPSAGTSSTPQTPYTPVNQAHTPSSGATSPQYTPSNTQGYIS
ncbi:hypothetical protein EDD21DRAFT_364745 [Dissophora ornata]|nr:hypothetical protein BGZ58_004816 [Dissophora ornata]KAI8604975.1 hypothetical protein EDD21DRAFT_364745 [Dissophora ornata]